MHDLRWRTIMGSFFLVLFLASGLISTPHVVAFTNGQNAALVLGQTTFTSNSSGTTQTTLYQPGGIVLDASGNLWVADLSNGRVLEFPAPFSTGESANIVLGEQNFTVNVNSCSVTVLNAACLSTPESLVFDNSGNLWVADTGNGRILEFASPFKNYENASIVIGEQNFTASSGSLQAPTQST